MFTEDELAQARALSVLEIAEEHGAKLKKSGRDHVGPCPACGGVDRFAVWPKKNVWNCRGYGGGDAIDLEMHLSGSSFPEAVETLIGESQSTTTSKRAPREPTPEELAAKASERRRQQFIEATAAQIITGIVPVLDTLAERYLSGPRRIDVEKLRDILERTDAIGFHPSVYLKEPGHPLHGHFLPAIVAIQTDPVTAAPTGGIARTYLDKDGRKLIGLDGNSMRAKSLGPMGVVRLSRDEDVLGGLFVAEGLENALTAMAKGFLPCWSTGSTSQMENFPVLDGIECLTILADHDVNRAGEKAAIKAAQRWRAAGREVHIFESLEPGDINDIARRTA